MASDLLRQIDRLLSPLRTRLANIVSRAVVKVIDDSKQLQLLQLGILSDETRDGIERFQNYGFTSVPKDGAEAVVLFVGGRRDHGLAIAVDDRRYRLSNLESGEVAVYTDQGDSIVIRRGGTIEVSGATKVVVDAPLVELAGNTQSAVMGTAFRTAQTTMNSTLTSALTAAAAGLTTAGADPTLLGLAPLAAAGLTAAAVGLTTASAAPTTFEAGSATYLSNKVKLS